MHVDDCEVVGNDTDIKCFKKALEREFSAVKSQEWKFKHCGIDYAQYEDCSTISHSQENFVEAMDYYHLDKERQKNLKSLLTTTEITCFRSIMGGMQWLERTRADHAAETSQLQTRRNEPTVADLKQANSLLRRVKDSKESKLVFRSQEDRPKRILVMADASLNSVKKEEKDVKRTQAGWLILLTYDTDSLDTDNMHILNWVTRKSTRVTKSTLASESVSRVAAVEDAIRIAGWLDEMYSVEEGTKSMIVKQETGGYCFPVDVATDCNSLHEALLSPMDPRPSDPGNTLWLKWLREIQTAGITSKAIWVSTVDMLGDSLTKVMDSDILLKVFRTGTFCIIYASLCGPCLVDAFKGRPPTKREKYEQAYWLVENAMLINFHY